MEYRVLLFMNFSVNSPHAISRGGFGVEYGRRLSSLYLMWPLKRGACTHSSAPIHEHVFHKIDPIAGHGEECGTAQQGSSNMSTATSLPFFDKHYTDLPSIL